MIPHDQQARNKQLEEMHFQTRVMELEDKLNEIPGISEYLDNYDYCEEDE